MRKTIVVGFDDQEPAKRALERAIGEARERSARLAVIAVAELPLDPGGLRNFGTLDDGPIRTNVDVPPALLESLGDARALVERERVESDYLWALGDPAQAIVDLAKDRQAILIVVGAHHEGFFSGLFGLSVQEQVQRHTGCDVLVVP